MKGCMFMHLIHTRSENTPRKTLRLALIGLTTLGALALSGCASQTDDQDPITLTLVTHDSFALADDTLQEFTSQTGVEVRVLASGDAGALVNQLVLTKDSPLGDVVFGI